MSIYEHVFTYTLDESVLAIDPCEVEDAKSMDVAIFFTF